jgi:hypothetical protein
MHEMGGARPWWTKIDAVAELVTGTADYFHGKGSAPSRS